MAFTRITAAEAAALIKNGDNLGLSGFTPAGTPKVVTAEIARIAEAEHAAGRPFQIGLFTGASTGDSCDGALTRAKALRYRAPYTTNGDFRKAVNAGEISPTFSCSTARATSVGRSCMRNLDVLPISVLLTMSPLLLRVSLSSDTNVAASSKENFLLVISVTSESSMLIASSISSWSTRGLRRMCLTLILSPRLSTN